MPISIAVTPPSMVAVQVVSETIPLKVMVLSACATVDSALQAEKIRAPARNFLLIFIFIPISIINDNQSVNCFMQRY
ncbi:hypothetical protein UUU_00830 [Klebsiella pneumoniae subsp. pneumoniae DSM 30104 = JCM 1662 = NBRC 14940]|nr:hypothetical protein UUU_00830 [Klebsiella pneumoniae subsp. pneumoniae DSM 30104 = JCM 1662 = NBRC 14940]